MNPTIHNFIGDDLDTRGYGVLIDAISCEVTEELNGGFTLTLRYPLHGTRAEYLVPANIIMAKPAHNQTPQAFRINQVKRSFGDAITVYANHISYDMSGYPIHAAHNYNNLASMISAINAFTWTTGAAAFHKFNFSADFTSANNIKFEALQSLRSWMGTIIDTYGGEWEYDNFDVFLKEQRGVDNGIRVSYGKNLAEYLRENDYTEYSHVCAYWKKSDIAVYGNDVSTGYACPFRVKYVDASRDYENQPTTAQLDAFAAAEVIGSAQTITVTPAQIGNDVIGLGDTVHICYETVFTTRVIKTVWDVLADNYKTLELGTKKASIADTIQNAASESTSKVIDQLQSRTSIYAETISSGGTGTCYTRMRVASDSFRECWSVMGCTLNITLAYGSCYYSSATIMLPKKFFSEGSGYPHFLATARASTGLYDCQVKSYDSTTGAVSLFVGNPVSQSSQSVEIAIYAVKY